MSSLTDSLNTVSLLMLLLLVSVIVNLYYINSSIESKRKNKKETHLFPSLLKKYLKEQSQKTANSKFDQSVPELFTTVVKLRSAYLMIEAKAVHKGIDSEEYWNLINAKLRSLVDIIIKFESNPTLRSIEKKVKMIKQLMLKSDDVEDRDILFSCLDRFYNSCVENSNIARLKKYDDKLSDILSRLGGKQLSVLDQVVSAHDKYLSQSMHALKTQAESNSIVADRLESSGSEAVDGLLDQYNNSKDSLERSLSNIKSSLKESQGAIAKVVLKNNSLETDKSDSSASVLEILEISEELQRKNEEEIVHLKRIVSNQKETIVAFEHEFSINNTKRAKQDSAPNESDQVSPFEEEVGRLKTNLRDAEFCITVLEEEQKLLQEKMKKVKEDVNSSDTSIRIDDVDVAELRETIKKLEAAACNEAAEINFLRVFHEFCQEAVKLGSLEDLAMHTFACLSEIGIDGQFIVKSEDREFVVSETGTIDKKVKVILHNLAIGESSQSSKSTKIFTRLRYLTCIFSLKDSSAISKNVATQALAFAGFADNVMRSIIDGSKSKSTRRTLDQQCNNIKVKTNEIDKQLLDVFSSVTKSVETNVKSIQELARAGGVNASAISKMRAYEQEIIKDIGSKKIINLKVKKAFIEILNDLENIY